ncbi:uncharacterized protein [Epargyreus clarus]|uniref:uncharacterized protein isoform X2 n=1 Tax=Epargyreus clarus TaxID=520877 RepID=UPI003C2B18E5
MSNITIAIPPFPCQDLAKLVLGYLAEEQLMTAYDEFLQSSPYLDAFRNEYDRIFMTSLKNILAEYRAVKIYVETCKPFILRRKLFQCTNLLEIVKFLVNHVDINKIQEGSADKVGPTNQTTSQIEATSLGSSVETTSLADLPGNTSYKRFIAKASESGSNIFNPITSSDQVKDVPGKAGKCTDDLYSTSIEASDTTDNVISSVTEKNLSANPNFLVNDHNSSSMQRVQDSNNVLNLVSHTRNESTKHINVINAENVSGKRISSDVTFQDFTSGVDSSSIKVTVPDSSTVSSESVVLQTCTNETDNVTNSTNINQGAMRPPFLIKIGSDHKNMNLYSNQTSHNLPRLASKESLWKSAKSNVEEAISPKITIISDVKLDNDVKMPPILKNVNSNPLLQMQTLFINGTPVYKQTPHVEQKYTKDEIMAMPTIILVPATGASKKAVSQVTQNNLLSNTDSPTIDITASDDDPHQTDNTILESSIQNSQKHTNDNETNKTVEVACHGSLPKDNTFTSLKTSTPHVLPPKRKSSSTPRRTSHIRVLDFTTPRRILHEGVSEQVEGGCSSTETPSETVSLPLLNKNISEPSVNKCINIPETVNSRDVDKGPTKETKASIKLYNWDSDLRALAYVGNGNIVKSETIEKQKLKKSKKKVSPMNHADKSKDRHDKELSSVKKEKKVTPKNRSTKLKTKCSESTDVTEGKIQDKAIIPVKPTINIVSRKKYNDPTERQTEIDKSHSKSNNSDEPIDTPELERMSLQNEIGAKLNISDLLETPYKQALYDIQMDTPRFLGTDLPDDPLSDIKITNIPTPRFLNTPKLTQNTPSSYSSRPTDYSSGGSYYKPDDQEYVMPTEIMEFAQSESVSTSNITKETEAVEVNVSIQKTSETKSRPVRKCTKNVSYNYSSPIVNKMKDIDDKTERSSTCSDISTNKSDKNVDKSEKYDNKKKISIPKKRTKKYKSPVKKETPNTFMKIKPRRTTPVKEVLGGGRKKSGNYNPNMYIKPQPKKLVTGKEKHVSFLPAAQAPVSTKSKRKSSSPRKLHCTKMFNSGNSRFNSSETTKKISKPDTVQVTNVNVYCDSDTDQLPLRWSDDASQESKSKTSEENTSLTNESDEITKIKEYISTTVPNSVGNILEGEGNLQVDLIKRGFDVETARMIERDLLDPPTQSLSNIQQPTQSVICPIISNNTEVETKKADKSIESDCSTSNNLEIVQDADDTDDFDLSVHDCNEDTNNYFTFKYDEVKFVPTDQVKLKETFSMEICIEDDVAIRLRAMPFNTVYEHESKQENVEDSNEITNDKPVSLDTLYTPRKAQCYEIFDSTLASLDTPLKPNSPKAREFETVTEIVLEVEKLENDVKQKPESKKRKRFQMGTSDDSSNGNKKVKTDTPYILNSKSIQNMDIESVLSKLHGP